MGEKYLIQEVDGSRQGTKGVGLVLLSAASFGLMPVLAKLAYAENLNLNTLLTVRFCLAAVILWIIWLLRRPPGHVPHANSTGRITLRALLPVIMMGAVAYVGQSFSYFTALSLISASFTGLLLYAYPPAVTLLAWAFLREPITGRKIAALVCALLGIVLVLQLGSSLLGGREQDFGNLNAVGVAWGLAAALIYSVYIVSGAVFARGFDPLFSSAVVISSAAIVYLFSGAVSGTLNFDVTPIGWAIAGLIALLCTVVAIVTFFAGLPLVGPSRAAILSTAEPAITVITATIVLGEQITLEQIAGGLLIVASVFVLQSGSAQVEQNKVPNQPKE
jgi:drug/metabolite transporter (DMT)-like permease